MQNIHQSMAGLYPAIDAIPEHIRLKSPLHRLEVLVDGALHEWDGTVQEVFSPVYIRTKGNELKPFLLGSYPITTVAELPINAALAAYDHGRGQWPAMTMQERTECVTYFAGLMKNVKNEVVKLMLWETGKTLTDSENEFDQTLDHIEKMISAAKRLNNISVKITITEGYAAQTKRLPLGIVLCMGSFDSPLKETFAALIPALLMGNTVLFKPSGQATLLFAPLLRALAAAFPRGSINTIYGKGREVAPSIMRSGLIDILFLTGSSKFAEALKKIHPRPNRLRTISRPGAKNAVIILPDADLELTVKENIRDTLSFNGQYHTALRIFFVHQTVVEKFNTILSAAVNSLSIGMPWENGVSITPLVDGGKLAHIQELADDALNKGAKMLNRSHEEPVVFKSIVQPVILYPVNESMRIWHEDQAGPLIPVVTFEDFNIPVNYVINAPYAQQLSIFGENTKDVSYFIDNLAGQVGRINLNVQTGREPDTPPFTGRKDSAEVTLSVTQALNAFSIASVVTAKYSPGVPSVFENILSDNGSTRLNYNTTDCS